MKEINRFLLETVAIILIFSIMGFAMGVLAIEIIKQ